MIDYLKECVQYAYAIEKSKYPVLERFKYKLKCMDIIEKLDITNEILTNSYKRNDGHIPSALSMLNYVFEVSKLINKGETSIVIGKPFGAMAYYTTWKRLGWIDTDTNLLELPYGIHDKSYSDGLPFVDYSEETMGNALGVATGIALTKQFTWCNISDAALQMGNTLEPLLYLSQLSHNGLPLLLTVDYNNSQVTGTINNINSIDPVIGMLESSNVTLHVIEQSSEFWNDLDLNDIVEDAKNPLTPPVVVLFKTTKGYPILDYVDNPSFYHYIKLDEKTYTKYSDEVSNTIKTINKIYGRLT